MRSPARLLAGGIRHEPMTGALLDRHHTQQLEDWHTLPATHTGAYRIRAAYHVEVYLYAPALAAPASPGTC